jgi:hypothetical protein
MTDEKVRAKTQSCLEAIVSELEASVSRLISNASAGEHYLGNSMCVLASIFRNYSMRMLPSFPNECASSLAFFMTAWLNMKSACSVAT